LEEPSSLKRCSETCFRRCFRDSDLGELSYFIFVRRTNEPIPPPALPEVAAFEDLKQAELKYEQAIEELSRVSQRKLAALNPDLAQIFNDNLATMDYYLNECKQAMQHDPENPLVHRYLLAAYQKKVDLLKTISSSDSL